MRLVCVAENVIQAIPRKYSDITAFINHRLPLSGVDSRVDQQKALLREEMRPIYITNRKRRLKCEHWREIVNFQAVLNASLENEDSKVNIEEKLSIFKQCSTHHSKTKTQRSTLKRNCQFSSSFQRIIRQRRLKGQHWREIVNFQAVFNTSFENEDSKVNTEEKLSIFKQCSTHHSKTKTQRSTLKRNCQFSSSVQRIIRKRRLKGQHWREIVNFQAVFNASFDNED